MQDPHFPLFVGMESGQKPLSQGCFFNQLNCRCFLSPLIVDKLCEYRCYPTSSIIEALFLPFSPVVSMTDRFVKAMGATIINDLSAMEPLKYIRGKYLCPVSSRYGERS